MAPTVQTTANMDTLSLRLCMKTKGEIHAGSVLLGRKPMHTNYITIEITGRALPATETEMSALAELSLIHPHKPNATRLADRSTLLQIQPKTIS